MNIAVIVPARLASKRLPGKAMLNICGIPMLERVRQQIFKSKYVSSVYIATCDQVIEEYFDKKPNTKVILTSPDHQSGTSRCGEAVTKLEKKHTHVLLVQGDEPLINPNHIDQFIEAINNDKFSKAWNAVSDCEENDISEQSVVKAVISKTNEILFCFRAPPFIEIKKNHNEVVKKMQGLMAFTTDYLLNLCAMRTGILESTESIEQLKIIENGDRLKVVCLSKSYPSVNTKSDLLQVISLLESGQVEYRN